MQQKYRVSLAILFQTIISSILFVYYYHNGQGMRDARWIKHIVYIFWLGFIYLSGLYAFKNHTYKWVPVIWNWAYAVVLCLMVTATIIEKIFSILPYGLLETTAALRFYFQTPIPFLVVLLIAKFKWPNI